MSAVARWVIRPTTERPGDGSSPSPQRPMPVSSLRCNRDFLGQRSSATSSSRTPRGRARRRRRREGRGRGFAPREGRRERTPSATVATQSAVAPPSSAAPPDVGGTVPVAVRLDDRPQLGRLEPAASTRALCRIAPRSIVTSERVTPHSRDRRGEPEGSAARVGGDRPTCSGTERAGEPVGDRSGRSRVDGSSPLARNAPRTPSGRRPSPPSRARAARVPRSVRPSGARTIVSGPLSRTTASKRSAQRPAASSRWASTQSGLDVEQPCELARVWRQHEWRIPLAGRRPKSPSASTTAGSPRAEELVTSSGLARPAEPRADRRAPIARSRSRARSSSASFHSNPRFTGSSARVSATFEAGRGHGERDVPASARRAAVRASTGRACRPGRAADDEQRARGELRVARAAPRDAVRSAGVARTAAVGDVLEPDVGDDDAAGVEAARARRRDRPCARGT